MSVYDDLVPKPEPKPTPAPEPKPVIKPEPTPEVTDVKSIFKSKTIWANLVGGAVALLAAIQGSDIVAANPEYAAYAATAMAVLNLFLRLVTDKPVSVTGN